MGATGLARMELLPAISVSAPIALQSSTSIRLHLVLRRIFQLPHTPSPPSNPLQQYLIGNAPRTRAWNLNNPGTQNLDSSVRRSFSLPREMSLLFEVDCLNTWNKVTFGNPSATWAAGSLTFGTITGHGSGYKPTRLPVRRTFQLLDLAVSLQAHGPEQPWDDLLEVERWTFAF